MAYLPRSERRIDVLEAFLRIAGADGFEGATVRRVSAELGMSAGNIHHLFGSAAELKREAFRHFAEVEIASLDAAAELPSPFDQLQAYLSRVAIGTDVPARRIWTSAGQEAGRDEAFAKVWAEKADIWLHRISDLLLALSGNQADVADATAAAWRLMAFAVGANSFAGPKRRGIGAAEIDDHITTLLRRELSDLHRPDLRPGRSTGVIKASVPPTDRQAAEVADQL